MKKFNLIYLAIGVVVVLLLAGGIYLAINFIKQAGIPKVDINKIVLNNLTDEEKKTFASVKEKLRANPKDVTSLVSLASLQKYNGDWEGALNTLRFAEYLDPQNVIVLNNEMEALYNLKKYDEAESKALAIIKINSQWLNAYRLVGDIYLYFKPDVYKTSKYPDLIKAGMALDATDINKLNFTSLLATYYKEVKNKDEAVTWWQKYYDLSPTAEVLKELNEVKSW